MKKKLIRGLLPIIMFSSDVLPEKAIFIKSFNLFSEIIESEPIASKLTRALSNEETA